MAQRSIKPDYLLNREGTSNKFYIICDAADRKHSLTGWGPANAASRGQWLEVEPATAQNKKTEKLSGGYRHCNWNEVPNAAILELVKRLNAIKSDFNYSHDGKGLILVDDASPRTRSPATSMRLNRALKKLHIWI